MEMIFAENEKVTIMNSKKEYKEVNRQSIADYCTKEINENAKKNMNDPVVKVFIAPEYLSKACDSLRKNEDEMLEVVMILMYLPFLERVTLLPEQIILIKILDKVADIKLRVSWKLYKFLNEL